MSNNDTSPLRFLKNVLWNWISVGLALFTGFFLSPYIIRKLGPEGYGVWALVFSLVGYYGLLDLGFRSAVVQYSARFKAEGNSRGINELLNTLVVYYGVMAAVLVAVTWWLATHAHRLFNVSAAYRDALEVVVWLVGISVSLSLWSSVYSGLLEGLQRFDLGNKAVIAGLSLRTFGSALLLFWGYGLAALALLAFASQMVTLVLLVVSARVAFPEMEYGRPLIRGAILKETAAYSVHTFVASLASQSLRQAPSLLIAHFLSVRSVAFYNVPSRLLEYIADAIGRVNLVTTPHAASLAATGQAAAVVRLGVFTNRYCLLLFTPVLVFLGVYGAEFLAAWVGPEVAAGSAPLLPALLLGSALAIAGQSNSSGILFGIARHRWYSYGLAVEAVASIVCFVVVLPRLGLLGGALVSSLLAVVVRCVYTPWLLCHYLETPFLPYMARIYLPPLGGAALAAIAMLLLKGAILPGTSWLQLAGGGAAASALCYGVGGFLSVDRAHRQLVWRESVQRLRALGREPETPGCQ